MVVNGLGIHFTTSSKCSWPAAQSDSSSCAINRSLITRAPRSDCLQPPAQV